MMKWAIIAIGSGMLLLANGATTVADDAKPGTAKTQPTNEALRRELLAMRDADQGARAEALRKGGVDALLDVRQRFDVPHTRRLKEIVAQHGWPGKSLVGDDGSNAAWLLVQHAPDRAFMEQCLALLEKAVAQSDAAGKDLAYLSDRVRTQQGKPQRYGTQFMQDAAGNLVPHPIEDEAHVDRRRRTLGLPTMAEQKALMSRVYQAEKAPQ